MKKAPIPANEFQRIAALKTYELLDTKSEQIFDSITCIAALVCNTPISTISLIDTDRQFIKSIHGEMSMPDPSREAAFCAHAINQPDMMEVQDATEDERFVDNPFVINDPKIRFYAGVPLKTHEKHNLGTLCVIGRKPQSLNETQKDILNRLSEIVMTLFEARKQTLETIKERENNETVLMEAKSKLEESLQDMRQQHHEMTLMSELSRILQACRLPDEAFNSLVSFCKQIFPEAQGSVCIADGATGALSATKTWGQENFSKNYFTADECWGLRRGQYYQTGDSRQDLICRHYDVPGDADPIATLCVPLMAQGAFSGLLTLQFPCNGTGRCMGDRQRLLAIALAEQTAMALSNIDLRATLHVQMHSDALTGLFNQKLLENEGNSHLRDAEMNHTKAAVLVIDIDHFKKINETHGHDAGNVVLQKIAELLKMNTRAGEFAYRLSNDEMLLIIPEITPSLVAERAESIRKAASHLHIRLNGAPLDSVTISMGVAIFPDQADNISSLVVKAQHLISRAKDRGGNTIEMMSHDKNS